MLVRITFWCAGDLGWSLGLRLSTRVRRTVARNQHVVRDGRSPEDAAGLGLEDVLMACLRVQQEGSCLLASMLRTASFIHQPQPMFPRGHPYGPDVHPRIYSLRIECLKVDRLWEDHERIRLCLTGLFGELETTQEPEGSAQQPQIPEESSSHQAYSRSRWRCADTC